MSKKTIGLDLSYTGTGIVVWNGKNVLDQVNIRTTKKNKDEERIDMIGRAVVRMVKKWKPALVGIENYAYGLPMGMARLGELGGVIKYRLFKLEQPVVAIPVNIVRRHVVGNGNASKDQVIDVAEPFIHSNDDNLADAWALAKYIWDKELPKLT